MRYLDRVFVTGGGGKKPDPPPDPAIAEEKARREAVALSHMDQRRHSKHGSASTVLTSVRAPGTQLTRPTDPIPTDNNPLAGTERQKRIDEMQAAIDEGTVPVNEVTVGRGDGSYVESRPAFTQETVNRMRQGYGPTVGVEPEGNTIQKSIRSSGLVAALNSKKPAQLSEADLKMVKEAKREANIGAYKNRTRSRVGVTSTQAARA